MRSGYGHARHHNPKLFVTDVGARPLLALEWIGLFRDALIVRPASSYSTREEQSTVQTFEIYVHFPGARSLDELVGFLPTVSSYMIVTGCLLAYLKGTASSRLCF